MRFDAIILAGGRSTRLGGEPKQMLRLGGQTMLERTLDAVADARTIVVVGDGPVREGVLLTREAPLFAGPAAALAAGVHALDGVAGSGRSPGGAQDASVGASAETPEATVVVSVDMPHVDTALPALLAAYVSRVGSAGGVGLVGSESSVDARADGVIALDIDGRHQYLAAIYRRDALREAIAHLDGGVVNASLRRLLGSLKLVDVATPSGSTADIDTWNDAAGFGIERPPVSLHAEGATP